MVMMDELEKQYPPMSKEYTLAELARRDAAAFEKAGL